MLYIAIISLTMLTDYSPYLVKAVCLFYFTRQHFFSFGLYITVSNSFIFEDSAFLKNIQKKFVYAVISQLLLEDEG